ncbi:MAG TPA: nicotinamide riboside transporter PnuC [Candidatus Dormibacteraeota bacterium]
MPIVLSIALAGGSVTRLLPFDWLEAFGFISGAWGVWMQVRENVWNWPVQLVSSALYVVVFLHARLFSDAGLNVVYVVLYMLGWYWWLRGGASHGPLVIHRITLRQTTALAAITVAATVVETVFLTAIHDSAPFMDALTTVLSLVALYLTARKVFESWHLWVLTNLLYIGLYVYKQLDLTALLYAIFAALSVAGLINWRRLLAEQRLHTAGTGPVTAAGAGSWSNRV